MSREAELVGLVQREDVFEGSIEGPLRVFEAPGGLEVVGGLHGSPFMARLPVVLEEDPLPFTTPSGHLVTLFTLWGASYMRVDGPGAPHP